MEQLAQTAIDEALRGNWKEAVKLNEQILKVDSKNKDALNRIGRAYLELGKFEKARANYKKVLKIGPYNAIAQKVLEKLKFGEKYLKKSGIDGKHSLSPLVTANLFIEEPGKTKTVSLIHLGDTAAISTLDAGEPVKLECHAFRVSVMTERGRYLGRLPDDISRTIIKLERSGNEFGSFIRSVTPEQVKIFIKETKRAQGRHLPPFPSSEKPNYVTFTPPDLIHEERPDVSATEEQT